MFEIICDLEKLREDLTIYICQIKLGELVPVENSMQFTKLSLWFTAVVISNAYTRLCADIDKFTNLKVRVFSNNNKYLASKINNRAHPKLIK